MNQQQANLPLIKPLCILALLFCCVYANAQDCNIGNEIATDDFGEGNFQVNYLLGVKFTLTEDGTLNSMNLIGNGTETGVQMAVYEDNNGVPNDLVAASDVGAVGQGITTLSTTPTPLPVGDYWVLAVYEEPGNQSNVNVFADGVQVYYQQLEFGSEIPANASDFITYTGQDFLYFL